MSTVQRADATTAAVRSPGDAVAYLRREAGITIERLAQMTGVSLAQIERVEAGTKHPTAAWLGVVVEAIASTGNFTNTSTDAPAQFRLRPNLLIDLDLPDASALAARIGWDDTGSLERALAGEPCEVELVTALARAYLRTPLAWFATRDAGDGVRLV